MIKKILPPLSLAVLILMSALFFSPSRSVAEEPRSVAGNIKLREQWQEARIMVNYGNLPELVHNICAEAIVNFYDFYGPTLVNVQPFGKYAEFPNRRISVLGITLADHMMARINNESLNQYISAEDSHEQFLSGVMQEINGYLRVHIFGVNSRGERRSYVVNVEMSEPVYRALNTYING